METKSSSLQLAVLNLDLIEKDPEQPRKDMGDLNGLAKSIASVGLQQPIVVRPIGNGRYRIIAGERRYRASMAAGLSSIPAIVNPLPKEDEIGIIQLIENVQRKDLHPIEEARAIDRLLKTQKISQADIAKSMGVAPSNVSQTLSILRLPDDVLQSLQTSEDVKKSALIELAKYAENPKELASKLAKLDAGELTVREARLRGRYKKRIESAQFHNAELGLKVLLRWKNKGRLSGVTHAMEAAAQLLCSESKRKKPTSSECSAKSPRASRA